ncbi:hypothetical protein KDW_44590 [Dictyobacter vulcani]|uniref:Uncharacterized protein n=2 Tax=Dictyobacter vulcani TaxID=2607529 RepID=A0A5J4KUX4_9CHLR|nr:hypothetical protein KDW_44590 [Dictyobacter vulcani]
MLELYRLGEELEFGDLVVHQDGVSHVLANSDKEENLDWDDIDTFEIGETYTRITAKNADRTGLV